MLDTHVDVAQVYGFHNSIFTALDLSSGEVLWRSRDFEGANLLRVGDRFLLLDRWGKLSLVSLNSEGATTHASARILEGRSWTAPTLIDNRLYARNHDMVIALDLSRSRSVSALPIRRPQRTPIEAPAGFLEAKGLMMAAYFRSDAAALDGARTALEVWAKDDRIGHLAPPKMPQHS